MYKIQCENDEIYNDDIWPVNIVYANAWFEFLIFNICNSSLYAKGKWKKEKEKGGALGVILRVKMGRGSLALK